MASFVAAAYKRIASTPVQFMLGAGLCALGLYHLNSVVVDKRETLDVLNQAIDARLLRLAELDAQADDPAQVPYPTAVDVDPLRHGAGTVPFNGFEPVSTVAPGPVPEYTPED